MANLRVCLFLDWGMKLQDLKGSHSDTTGRTRKPHVEELWTWWSYTQTIWRLWEEAVTSIGIIIDSSTLSPPVSWACQWGTMAFANKLEQLVLVLFCRFIWNELWAGLSSVCTLKPGLCSCVVATTLRRRSTVIVVRGGNSLLCNSLSSH